MDLKQYVSEVKDWPSAGVSFKDITTIMDNGEAYGYATDQIVEYAKEKNIDPIILFREIQDSIDISNSKAKEIIDLDDFSELIL